MMKETSPQVNAVFYYYCAVSLVKLKEEFVTIEERGKCARKIIKDSFPHLVSAEISDGAR